MQEPSSTSPVVDREARTWGMLAHLSALIGLFMPIVGNILAPLIIWLIYRDKYAFVDDQARESLNFQISMSIYLLVASLLILIVIGIVLVPVIVLIDLIYVIIAATRASNGESFRYPFNLRLVP